MHTRILRSTLLASAVVVGLSAQAIVTPAPDRAFSPHPVTGANILTQMVAEASNPLIAGTVVHFVNTVTVPVVNPRTGQTNEFQDWTGTLITPEWVLTCAHTVQGTDGRGAGVFAGDIYFNSGGASFPDPALAEVAEVKIHPDWRLEDYEHGNDLALIRLAHPVANVAVFPLLSATAFAGQRGVVMAGYGQRGNGTSGGDTNVGQLAVGINSLDGIGGQLLQSGNGQLTTNYTNWPASVAFMDFDQWELHSFDCVPDPDVQLPVVLGDYSTMGLESEISTPVHDPCPGSAAASVPGVFASPYCDFLPGGGDSGGPAFLWYGAPNIPQNGFYVSSPATLFGVVSYRGRGMRTEATSLYGNVAAYTLVQPHLGWIYTNVVELANRDSDGDGQTDHQEWLARTDPYTVTAVPANYNAAPGYGTYLNSKTFRGHEVVVDTVTLAGETNEPDGRVRLSFNATLRNTGGGYHYEPAFLLPQPEPPDWPVEIVPGMGSTADLAPSQGTFSTASTVTPVSLICAAADVPAVKSAVLNKQRVAVRGVELYQFTSPVVAADAATDNAYASHLTAGGGTNKFATVDFSTDTPLLAALTPGQLLLENPSTQGYRLKRPGPLESPNKPGLYQVVHAEEACGDHEEGQAHKTELLEVTAVERTNGIVRVSGYVREMYMVLRAGTQIRNQNDAFDDPVRDPFNPPAGNSLFTGDEWEKRGEAISAALDKGPRTGVLADLLGFFTLHFPFNEVQLGPGITLDGEYLMRGLNLDLIVTWRNTAISKVAMTVTMRSETDLVLTAEGGASNGGLSLFEKERTLVYAPLPPITIPVASFPVTLAPALTVKVGCEVTAGSRIVVPIQSSTEAGFYMGWDSARPAGSQFFYEPIHEITPLDVSPPTLSQALQANANVWIEGGIEVLIQGLAGPYIATRATGNFTLNPTANPWWSLDGDLDLRGGFRFRFPGFEIADPGGSLLRGPGFLRRNPGGAFAGTNPANPLDNVEGDQVRWGRLLKQSTSKPGPGSVTRVAGAAEEVFVLLQDVSGPFVARLNATGEVTWAVSSLLWAPRQIAGTPDGGVIVAGNAGIGGLFIQKLNGAGGVVWSNSLAFRGATNQPQNPYLAKVLVRDLGGGQHDIYLAGYRDRGDHPGGTWGGGTMDTDPFILKYNSAGALQWSKLLDSVDHEVVTDALVRRDGGLLLCGHHKLSPDGTNVPGPGIMSSGWLLWTDADGSFQKARRSASALGMYWSGVTEAPNGDLYACGQRFQTVLFTQPTMQVGKYSTDGDLLAMVTVGETILQPPDRFDYADMGQYGGSTTVQANPSPTSPDTPHSGLRDWLPNSGRTPWDEGLRLAWTPAGVVVVGNTALGNDRAPVAACFNDTLGVRWFTCYEREFSEDQFFDLTVTDNGVLVLGNTAQLFDITGATPGGITNGAALVMKLPFDGHVPLHPNSKTIQRFLQPGVHDSLWDQEEVGIPSPTADYLGTYSVTLSNAPQATVAGTMPPALTPTPNLVSVPLESGNAGLPMTYAQWASYNFLPPGADAGTNNPDGDALLNRAEYFFGTDPLIADPTGAGALTIDWLNGNIRLNFLRALAASNAPFAMEFTANHQQWQTESNGILQSLGFSNRLERLRLNLPASGPGAFFRLRIMP